MDNEIKQAFERVEDIMKSNYNNLDRKISEKISELRLDIKEDIKRIETCMEKTQVLQLSDHDKIVESKGEIVKLEENLNKLETREKDYGLKTNGRIEVVEKEQQRFSLSYAKIGGIVIGGFAVISFVYKVVEKYIFK